jgi:hypothetical protein
MPPYNDGKGHFYTATMHMWRRPLSILDDSGSVLIIAIGHWLKAQPRGKSGWRTRHGVSRGLREKTMHALARIDLEEVHRFLGGAPNSLRFVRLASRSLDDDNLRTAFKPIRDQVCCWLGGDNTPNARANDGKRSGFTFDYGEQ